MPQPAEIEAAAARTRPYLRQTPVLRLVAGELGPDVPVTLKLELLQHAGSFKPRGAFNRLLSAGIVPASGVIAASGGNHGAAVAFSAQRLGVRAEIFVPEVTGAAKLARIRSYGAALVRTGATYAEAFAASAARAAETGALVVHAYDQDEVLAGQGTLGRELELQAPELTHVLVAVGGGGLIGGVAAWYRGRAQVIAVEPEACPCLNAALAAGEPVDAPVGGIAADSLGARRIGSRAFAVAKHHVAQSVLVTDEAILEARRLLWDRLCILAEPGGATALAALTSGRFVAPPGARVGVIICGGNTEPGRFA